MLRCLSLCKLEVLVTYSYTIWALEITYGLWFASVALRGVCVLRCSCLYISISAIVQDPCRMGVWLGWHICYNATQVSQGQLRENRNLSSSIRAKAALIYVLSVPVHNVNKYLFDLSNSLCVKARPSDPLVYVWILWCHSFTHQLLLCNASLERNLFPFIFIWSSVLWADLLFTWVLVRTFYSFLRLEVSEKLPQG